jgi:ankyrin repeat protein
VLSEYSLSLTVTPTDNTVDPRGLPAVLCSGTGWVLGYPWGPPPHPGPAVHRYGSTALHWAASQGNRRMIRLLVASGADVTGQDDGGCAVCACGESAVECAGRVPAARRPCRDTPLHYAAYNGDSACVAELLLRGADGAVQTIGG